MLYFTVNNVLKTGPHGLIAGLIPFDSLVVSTKLPMFGSHASS